MNIEKNYSLADETTFKVGGPAEFFVAVDNKKQLETAAKEARKKETPITILGGGSNVIISSKGIKGLVIKIRSGEITLLDDNLLQVGAGVSLPRLSRFAMDNSFKGLEWALGVPGTAGGAIYGNAGAFNQSISEFVEEVEVLRGLKTEVISSNDLEFGYRMSTFKRDDLIILSASLRLKNGDYEEIKKKTEKYLAYRDDNHPLDMPCAGSIFKNPTGVSEDLFNDYPELEEFKERGSIPAGYLIEKVGLKGTKKGGAMISKKHANFIVNADKASSEDIINLIKKAKKKVKEKFGVDLEEEVRYIN